MSELKPEYRASAPTLKEKENIAPQVDVSGNQKITMVNKIDRTNDTITTYEKGATATVVTASALLQTGAGKIVGYHINSHTAGATFRFSDAITATTPYLGAAVTTVAGTLAGTYMNFPASVATGVYVTIAGTIDMTIFTVAD